MARVSGLGIVVIRGERGNYNAPEIDALRVGPPPPTHTANMARVVRKDELFEPSHLHLSQTRKKTVHISDVVVRASCVMTMRRSASIALKQKIECAGNGLLLLCEGGDRLLE